MSVWVYIEVTCDKCAGYQAHGHVRYAKDFAKTRSAIWKEAQERGAKRDKEGRVMCIKCSTPMSEWPLEWH